MVTQGILKAPIVIGRDHLDSGSVASPNCETEGMKDGTPEATQRLERVLTTDPGMGVVRHANAGYELAIEAAKRHGIKIPMLK